MNAPLRLFVCAALLLAGAAAEAVAQATGQPAPRDHPVIEIDQKMPERVEPTSSFQIDILVRNTGTAAVEELVVTDVVPAGYEVLEANPVADRVQGTLTWRAGRLGPREQWLLRLRLGPKAGEVPAPPCNTVDATFQQRSSSVCSSQLVRPELVLNVSTPPAVFTGQPVALQFTVSNQGSLPARDVTLQAQLAEGLVHPQGSDLEAAIGTLGPGESHPLTLKVSASRSGELRSKLIVRAQGTAPVEQEVVLHVEESKLNLVVKGPEVLHLEWTGLYELTVQNEGTGPARQLVVIASLPEGIAFDRASDKGVYDQRTHSIRWELGEMRAGEKRALAWNGKARTVGDLECKVRLVSGQRTHREAVWTTRVVPEGTTTLNSNTQGPSEE
jgi:hypothetical protein